MVPNLNGTLFTSVNSGEAKFQYEENLFKHILDMSKQTFEMIFFVFFLRILQALIILQCAPEA